MGIIKFMMPNKVGIYLHDTPDKTVFNKDARWISNGCVRLQDARRLATWLFGAMPKGDDPNVEKRVELPERVPVFVTYLTAAAKGDDGQIRTVAIRPFSLAILPRRPSLRLPGNRSREWNTKPLSQGPRHGDHRPPDGVDCAFVRCSHWGRVDP